MKGGKPLFKQWDYYIVRDEIWSQAGMAGLGSGYLCTSCLSKRLGRGLTDADYVARAVAITNKGLQFVASPDYLKHYSVKR